jgi:dTMP kinase
LQFIVIDGLDASGKSTQAKLLSSFLKKRGWTVFLRMHPSNDNLFGIRAKYFLQQKGKSAHFNAALFYMCDVIRSVIIHSWRRYDCMIFVRYLMGTAYLPKPLERIAYHFFATIVPTSSFMFFLDVSPAEAYKRVSLRGEELEMFESLEELEKIRQKALALALEDNWIIVEADRAMDQIQEEIRRNII